MPDFEPRKEPEPIVLPPAPVVPQAPAPQQRAATPVPVESEEEEEQPVPEKVAPKKGRVSRAKRDKAVHICDKCGKVMNH